MIAAGLSRQAPQVDVLEAADLMYALAAPLNFIQLELSFSPAPEVGDPPGLWVSASLTS